MDSRAVCALTDGGAWTMAGHLGVAPPAASLGDLLAWAVVRDYRAVWLLSGHPYPTHRADWWQVPRPWRARYGQPQGLSVPTVAYALPHWEARRGGITVYDLAPRTAGAYQQYESRWPWLGNTPAQTLLRAVADTERAWGGPLGVSPGAMGLRLMGDLLTGHPDWLVYETPDDVPMPLIVPPGRAWWPEGNERATGYLHMWDGNAAYLAAAQGVSLGCGQLIRREGIAPGSQPGIYYVSGNLRGPVITRAGWYDRGAILAALAHGQVLGECPAYVWAGAHQALRTWADRVWASRQRATVVPARAAIKNIYTAALGRLATGEPGSGIWYRPLWRAAVAGESSRRVWARVLTLQRAGHCPVLVDVDTIGCITGDPDPASILPDVRDRLGQYKHSGSYRLDPVVIDALRAGDLGAVQRWRQRRDQEGQGHAA